MQNLSSNLCGCCEGLSEVVPVRIYNRPGLNTIAYRIGNHAEFKEALLATLSATTHTALNKLTTRENDDFTIALLDGWSMVADVLTFYQERIANEAYLNTATEQLSVLELARLIGYELRPGVAAATYLSFTLDENAGVSNPTSPSGTQNSKPASLPIMLEPGIKVQSVPGPNETPQTFETTEKIEARAEWNALKPRMTQPQLQLTDNRIIVINGTNNDVKLGDVLLLENSRVRKIVKIEAKEDSKTTWLYLSAGAVLSPFPFPSIDVTGSPDVFKEIVPLTTDNINKLLSNVWDVETLEALIKTQGWTEEDVKDSISKTLTEQASTLSIAVFRKRAAVFGYNAMKQPTYTLNVPDKPQDWVEWTLNENGSVIYLDTAYEQILPGSFIAVQTKGSSVEGAPVYRAEEVNIRPRTAYGLSSKSTEIKIPQNQNWLVFIDRILADRRAALDKETASFKGALPGKESFRTLHKIKARDSSAQPKKAISAKKNSLAQYSDRAIRVSLSFIRDITVHAQSVPLILAETTITEPITGDTIFLDGFYLHLKKGQKIVLSGERADLPGVRASEMKLLNEVLVVNGFTLLLLKDDLSFSYVRSTVAINANVAGASHGETVSETLGSGDAGKPFQKFILKQPPLTFVSAATASGTESTLQIRVNDILWQEASSLYARESNEHIYITRQDDAGKTTVIFGDGKTGARLRTGIENIRATYRKGIGSGGLLKAQQLSQLITRPLGVKGVTNPLKTSGAEDPEQLKDARRNATLTIFTLGRIVSLQDYEDFARSFAGIAKSLATWTWTGQKRSVHLTVAGINGAVVDGDLHTNLLKAIINAGIPEVPVALESYTPIFFRLFANIGVQPDYLPEKVIAAVEAALREKFSFAQRDFGQPVSLSEVITVLQNTEGVTAVDVDKFFRTGTTETREDRIVPQVPRPTRSTPEPAELLTLDAGPLNLQIMP